MASMFHGIQYELKTHCLTAYTPIPLDDFFQLGLLPYILRLGHHVDCENKPGNNFGDDVKAEKTRA